MRSLRVVFAGVAIGAFGLTQLAADAREQFELQVSKQLIPEAGPMAICLLMTGKEAYSFLPPANWRIEADKEERKVSLIAPDRTLVTIHTAKSGEMPTSGPKLELRDQVLGRFRGVQVIDEWVCYAEGGAGRAFNLEWKAESGARFTTASL